jgi:hypothetical protein
MSLYELRTYTLHVGKMAEATRLYQELGFPALSRGGHEKRLVGYFQSDTGMINQIVHLWKRRLCRGVRLQVPPPGDDAGGQAAPCRAVGSAPVTSWDTWCGEARRF